MADTGNTYSQGPSSPGVPVGIESWAEPGQPAPQPLTIHWWWGQRSWRGAGPCPTEAGIGLLTPIEALSRGPLGARNGLLGKQAQAA